MALGSTQPLRGMSTRNLPGGKRQPAPNFDNLTAICEPLVSKMWEPRRLTTLWASTFSASRNKQLCKCKALCSREMCVTFNLSNCSVSILVFKSHQNPQSLHSRRVKYQDRRVEGTLYLILNKFYRSRLYLSTDVEQQMAFV
jgi:hypothetical protein